MGIPVRRLEQEVSAVELWEYIAYLLFFDGGSAPTVRPAPHLAPADLSQRILDSFAMLGKGRPRV
jgi:hypothetical protein